MSLAPTTAPAHGRLLINIYWTNGWTMSSSKEERLVPRGKQTLLPFRLPSLGDRRKDVPASMPVKCELLVRPSTQHQARSSLILYSEDKWWVSSCSWGARVLWTLWGANVLPCFLPIYRMCHPRDQNLSEGRPYLIYCCIRHAWPNALYLKIRWLEFQFLGRYKGWEWSW